MRVPRVLAVAGVVVALLGWAAAPANADPHGDKNRVDHQLAEVQALYEDATSAAQAALSAYTLATQALPAAQAKLADARGVVLARRLDADRAAQTAQAAQVVAERAGRRVSAAQRAVDDRRTQLSALSATIYQGGALAAVDALLMSPTPVTFVDRVGYLDQLASTQRQLIDATVVAKLVAGTAADNAERARQDALAASQAATSSLDQAVAARALAAQAQLAVSTLVAQQAAAMTAANAQRDAVLAQYNALKAQSEQVAGELRAAGASGARFLAGAPGLRAGAIFIVPVTGAEKSSDFGMRFDPYYQVWQLHAGVDLAAPGGAPIYAAAAGTVVRAGWNGGYGNYTCLYHGSYQGRGLSTCYGHQSRILVHPGQQVDRGQVIGLVGSTGASTGYHLHFEVRVDGGPVQPLSWLPSCLC